MRTAFYPCCETDVIEPVLLLTGYVERIVFCDLRPRIHQWKRRQPKNFAAGSPVSEFAEGDARNVMQQLPTIDVLFYRRDSNGDGGSGLFVLGDVFLRPLMTRFSSKGGFLLTDGSNSRGSNFKRMIRKSGLIKFGRQFIATPEQPYLESHALWRIAVSSPLEQPQGAN